MSASDHAEVGRVNSRMSATGRSQRSDCALLDGGFRRKWVVPIEAHERPLSHVLPTFLQSYGSSNDTPGGDSIDNRCATGELRFCTEYKSRFLHSVDFRAHKRVRMLIVAYCFGIRSERRRGGPRRTAGPRSLPIRPTT